MPDSLRQRGTAMRPWTLAARTAVGVLAGALALALTGCGPSLADALPPVAATVSPAAGSASGGPSQPATPPVSPSLPPGDKAYLQQIAETLPDLDTDDEWKIQQATWTCVELDAGMTLRGAATTSALVSE